MEWFTHQLDIRYADTDAMGVVHHASYIEYCELCRIHMLNAAGLPYHTIEEAGIFLMVNDVHCRYKQAIRFGETVFIRARVLKLSRRVMSFEYEIHGEDPSDLRFTAVTKHLVTARAQSVVSLPPEMFAVMKRFTERGPEDS